MAALNCIPLLISGAFLGREDSLTTFTGGLNEARTNDLPASLAKKHSQLVKKRIQRLEDLHKTLNEHSHLLALMGVHGADVDSAEFLEKMLDVLEEVKAAAIGKLYLMRCPYRLFLPFSLYQPPTCYERVSLSLLMCSLSRQ